MKGFIYKKNKIKNLLHSKGYVSIETLIVSGLIIATGAFLISKLIWKGKDVAISSNNSMSNASKSLSDNSFNSNQNPNLGGGDTTEPKIKDVTCSLENPPNLADYEYAVIDDDFINSTIQKHKNNSRFYDEDELKKWGESFRNLCKPLEGSIAITSYKGKANDITIPSCIDGKKVTCINYNAFHNNKLTKVTIPNSVIHIGESAFEESGLKSVNIPNSVTYIGNYAFRDNNLTEITLPNSITSISAGLFVRNPLTEITIPDSVTSIGCEAFSNNQLTSVTIPKSVTIMNDEVFTDNPLKSVTIPKVFDENKKKYFDKDSDIKFNLI